MDRFDCYEACLQQPDSIVAFLRAAHGHHPRILGEDFCGTAAVSRAWVDTIADAEAIAIDADTDTIAAARARAADRSITFHTAEVMHRADPADIIFVGNFSIGEFHDADALAAYLSHARGRLGERGVFVCDMYGGPSALEPCAVHRVHQHTDPVLGAVQIRYTWEQVEANPATGMVSNACHFRIQRSGQILEEFDDAFEYRWRLWSPAALREAMLAAGFGAVEVTAKDDGSGEDFVVWVVARAV